MPRAMTDAARTAIASKQQYASAYMAEFFMGDSVKAYVVTGQGEPGDVQFEDTFIRCASGGLSRFYAGQSITVAGSDHNDGHHTIAVVLNDYALVLKSTLISENSSSCTIRGNPDISDSVIRWASVGGQSERVLERLLVVEASVDDGRNWLPCHYGKPIPGINAEQSYDRGNLRVRQCWMGNAYDQPDLHLKEVFVEVQFNGGETVTRTENTTAELLAGTTIGSIHVENDSARPDAQCGLTITDGCQGVYPNPTGAPVFNATPFYPPAPLCLSWGSGSWVPFAVEPPSKNKGRLYWAYLYQWPDVATLSGPVERQAVISKASASIELRMTTGADVTTLQYLCGWQIDARTSIDDPVRGPRVNGFGVYIRSSSIYIVGLYSAYDPQGYGCYLFWNTLASSVCLTPNAYHSISIVFDGATTLYVYINGRLVSLVAFYDNRNRYYWPITLKPGTVLATSGEFQLGRTTNQISAWNEEGQPAQLHATIISCRLWARALTQGEVAVYANRDLTTTEIALLKDNGTGDADPPGLRACWQNLQAQGSNIYIDQANSIPITFSGPVESTYLGVMEGQLRTVAMTDEDGEPVQKQCIVPVRVSPALSLATIANVLRVTSAPFSIPHGGHVYSGVGQFAMIEEIKETVGLDPPGLNVSLSGVDGANISLALSQLYHGRPANIYLAFFDENGQLVVDPVLVYAGLMDTMTVKLGQEASVSLSIESRLLEWRRPRIIRWNDEAQKARYPGDLGLSFVAGLVTKAIWWPNKVTSAGGN